MMRGSLSERKSRIFPAVCLALCLAVSQAGCGGASEPAPAAPEDVALMEPVGIGESVEAAARRDLYDAAVYNGIICPYTEEYSLERGMNFKSYAALPGDAVSKGSLLVRTNTEEMDKKIEEMEKSISRDEKEFAEYCAEVNDSLKEVRRDVEFWGGAVERWAEAEPAPGPSYEAWAKDNQFYETKYRNALISMQKQEEQLKQKTELHELDAAYNRVLLERLRADRDAGRVLSGQKGVVANVRILNGGDYISGEGAVAAVVNPDRKLLKCEYISKAEIDGAEQVFAIIDGKRYAVEYEPMESEEYKRLEEKNGKVYTTFYLPKEAEAEAELGSYVCVVVIKRAGRGLLCVPKDSIEKFENESYVYVYRDGGRIYTPVTTGMQDGVYTEILSGVKEGDKVVTKKEASVSGKTAVLGMGSVSHEFSKTGSLFYPTQEWITCPGKYGTVYFEEMAVDLYQQVKAGDVLFRIRVKPDELELERKERELLRQRERLAKLEKKPEENKKAIEQGREGIAELEKLLEEIKADYAATEVRAPYDGIVTNLSTDLWWNRLKKGDLLQRSQGLIMLAKQGSNYVMVEDPGGLINYGNQAKIEYAAANGSRRETAGQAVTLGPAGISAELLGEEGIALIRISGEDVGEMASSAFGEDGRWRLSEFKVTVATRKMENVLLVPKKAVQAYGNVTYVRLKREDGSTLMQSFLAGGSDDENYWAAEGLAEGMEVCIE